MISIDLRSSCCQAKEACCPPKTSQDKNMDLFLNVLEKVSLVALSALSLYTSWQLFLPFFAAGAALGVYYHFQQGYKAARMAPSCTQGVLEQISGIKLPPAAALVANVAITAAHTLHHATVFVPLVAVSAGGYAGKAVCDLGAALHRQIFPSARREPVTA